MVLQTLKQIGLNDKQSRIYVASLELGPSSIQEIAKRAGIKRTTVHDLMDQLVAAGYIMQTTHGRRRRFVAARPEELKKILRKREALLDQVLPELKSLSNVEKDKPKVWFYEGIDGLKKVYEDLLKYKDIKVYGWSSEDAIRLLGDKWCNAYIEKRKRRNIEEILIYPLTITTRKYWKADLQQARESKIVDPTKYKFDIEINVYLDRVAMMSAKDKVGVIIESAPIANTLRVIFRMCWDNLKQAQS